MKTYYTVTVVLWSDHYKADVESVHSLTHKRDDLPDEGLRRILVREGRIDKASRIARVEKAAYVS